MIIIGLIGFNIILNIIIVYLLYKLNKKEFTTVNNIYIDKEPDIIEEELLEDTINPMIINKTNNMDFSTKIPVYKTVFKNNLE